MNDYPATVAEVIDDNMKFRPETILAMNIFKFSRPYRGSIEQRIAKFRNLHFSLCQIYGKRTKLEFGPIDGSFSGSSYYDPIMDRIVIQGSLSVITLLHEIAHSLGKNEKGACKWSINLFRRVFPGSYSRCAQVGHCLVKREEAKGK